MAFACRILTPGYFQYRNRIKKNYGILDGIDRPAKQYGRFFARIPLLTEVLPMPNAALQADRYLPAPRPTIWFFPALVLIASLATTLYLWQLSSREARNLAETQLNNQANEITGHLLKRLQENENMLLGGNALFSVRGDALTRQEWHQYASSLRLDVNNPGVLGFGFSTWVPQALLANHLSAIRAEGFKEYTIYPAGERPCYTAIIWLEPFTEMNQKAFGYDMYAEPVRQAAMNRARDTGETSISGKVILVQEGKQDIQNGILMYIPSYRQGMPTGTVEQRRAALRGFVYSPIRMNDFVHGALVNIPEQVEINVYGAKEALPDHLLFSSRQTPQQGSPSHRAPAFFTSRTIEVYGAAWHLTFARLPGFEFYPSKSLVILLVGTLASLLISLVVLMQARSRRQAANELLAQQKFALHIKQTPLAVIEWNKQLQVTAWNPAAEKIFGYPAEEAMGHQLTFLFPPNEQAAISSALCAVLLEKQNKTGDYINIAKNGQVIACEWYSAALVDQQGEIIGAATLVNDVTAAKHAGEQLRSERNLLYSVMNGTRNAHLVYLDRDFNFIHVNQAYAKTCGYRPEEMVGKNHFALYPNKENEAIFQRVRDTGESFEVHDKPFEFPNQPERGVTWWDWMLNPVKDQPGKVIGFVFSLIETTARKKAELALRASETQFRLLFEQHSAIMLLIDPASGFILNANEAAAKFYGYSRAALRRMHLSEINTRSREELQVILKKIQEEKEKHFTASHRLADGSMRSVDVYTAAINTDKRQLNFAIIHDITDRVKAEADRDRFEAQNRQLQKTESLSRMAGAIAHHINNQLQAVMISLELLDETADEHQKPTRIRSIISTAIRSAEKAAEVSSLLLTYLARVPVTFEPLDLAATCSKAQPVWLVSKPKNVDFQIELPESGPVIHSNASQIQLLVTNLLTNAWEACENSPGSVTLTITTVDKEAIVPTFRYPVDFTPSDQQYACIAVADSGCGIQEQMFDQIFDPFFSTKFTGRGMGLPVALGIIRAHHGAITVESLAGRGSTFRVYLPISEKVVPKREPLAVTSQDLPGRGTILIVEDVPLIREIVATMLKSLGYAVLQAEDGAKALELFARHQQDIACVISDIVMPRMNGWQTLKALRRRAPGIPVIFASGYSEAQILEESHDEMPDIYLEKPFQFAKLRNALAHVLAQKGK